MLFKLKQVIESLIEDLTALYEPLWEPPVNSSVLRATFLPGILQIKYNEITMQDAHNN